LTGVYPLSKKCLAELVSTLSMVMDMEENIKLYHGWRVALFADRIGKVLGMPTDELFFGGLLHDIGALGMEDHIVHRIMNGDYLNDPKILAHPLKGAAIVKRLPGMERIALFVEDHHERWDGKGYPAGKKGREISGGGQVILAADLIDISLRHIKKPDIKKIVDSFRGFKSFFRPDIYEAALEVLGDIPFVSAMVDYNNLRYYIESRIQSEEDQCSPDQQRGEIFINVFADIIDAKHAYTGGHSRRVGEYSLYIGRALNIGSLFEDNLYKAALLHDFGKVAVPKRILDARRRLSEAEFNIVKQHPVHTVELLNSVTSLSFLAEAAGGHHERYDGKGYPRGLRGSDIPLYSQIISLADSLDAITSDRPYQKARSFHQAAEIIGEMRGTQFDPHITDAALEAIKEIAVKEKIV
jgi:HD-GYP domain-containing protein (c-di-GMP phosphodiesterase class II)